MAEIEFELFNNQLVQQLVGPQDGNLKIIEKALGAEIAAFGNRIRISGDEEAVRQAKNAVDALYSKVSRGIAVGEQEVLAAVRISGAEANVKPQVNIDDIVLKTKKRHIYPRSATQAEYIVEMMNNELVFGLGPAGTGKTYLAVALAVTMMLEGSIDKIILSRPAVEAGENLGFLPGDLKDKVDPYLRPLYDALYEMLPAEQVDKKLAAGEIEIAPLAFMRGRTLSNAFVILDEAQNTTPMQMKMFLTRLGENSRMVVNGDLSQVDLPRGVVSGLRDALDTLRGSPRSSAHMNRNIIGKKRKKMKTTLNLNIGDKNWDDRLPDAAAVSENVFQTVINRLKPEFLQGKKEVGLNVELGGDEEIQALNRQFRNLDKPTNVLSFANIDDDDFFDALPEMTEVELGDIIIAFETMAAQSAELEIGFKEHYIHILVHGILHLLGYDHTEEEERKEMEALETRLLAEFNIADPYGEKE